MKKTLLTIISILCLTLITFTFVACGSGNGGKGEYKTNIMEAEFTDLTGVYGGGHSSEASGVDMIFGDGTQAQKDAGWSSGYFIGFTHRAGVVITFKFNAEDAATGVTLMLRLGSELGNLTFDPLSFGVELNGTSLNYTPITVSNTPVLAEMKFFDKTVATNATLKKGENVIKLIVLENELAGGTTAGPIIDCIKVTTNVALNWTEKTENPSQRGSI